MSLDELHDRATFSVPEAAKLLGVGTSTAWRAIRAHRFPVEPLWVGSRCLVPAKPLLRLLEGSAQRNGAGEGPTPFGSNAQEALNERYSIRTTER